MMKLKVARKWFTDKTTIGILYINGKFFCYTLEDVVRPAGEKVLGKTAIPWGIYQLIITYSNRFKRPLPLLVGVPNFSAIRMHNGNCDKDTEGCILVGMTHTKDFIGGSVLALEKLMSVLEEAYDRHEPIEIEITAEATE
jgi:hypothetical protein